MSQFFENKKVFSLLEVTKSIQRTISERYSSAFWVLAEMNKLNYYTQSGHCFPELVEKQDNKVIALMNGVMWKSDFDRVNKRFLEVLEEPLRNGIKILFLCTVNYDPVHGLSLQIKDIDPSFSLGELEKEKTENIKRLQAEKLFDKNRQLSLPLLPQRIAIISVETSKGYSDFIKVLDQNPYGFKFFRYLFPALLQGERSVISILRQLKNIQKVQSHFDIVAIIRGGGGDVGLSSYNNYDLAKAIANFPLPVITGIGHSTNETVSEMVSYKNAITPTELADWLIYHFRLFADPVEDARNYIFNFAQQMLAQRKRDFISTSKLFRAEVSKNLLQEKALLEKISDKLRYANNHYFELKRHELSLLEKVKELVDPDQVLKRGFTMAMQDGRIITTVSQLKKNNPLEILFSDGKSISNIDKIISNGK